jgi:hypothetical protein
LLILKYFNVRGTNSQQGVWRYWLFLTTGIKQSRHNAEPDKLVNKYFIQAVFIIFS